MHLHPATASRAHAQDGVGGWHASLVFEPLTLLEKLAALTPRPRINLVLYHGVLAPHAGWRARVVAYGAPPGEAPVAAPASPGAKDEPTWRRTSFRRSARSRSGIRTSS